MSVRPLEPASPRAGAYAMIGLLLCGSLACASPTGAPAQASNGRALPDAPSASPPVITKAEPRDPPVVLADAADTPAADSVPASPAPSPDVPTQDQKRGSSRMKERASSALEGVIIGTVIGAQVGSTYGAAVGAVMFGLYGLITGDVPFEPSPGSGRAGAGSPEDELDQEIEEELDRQEELESEIEAELRRQEELLAAISKQETINESVRSEQQKREQHGSSDPLAAPRTPYEREIPDSIFETSRREVEGKRQVVKTLDADRDGRPEIEIVYDHKSGQLVSRSEDTDYDGMLDAQNVYAEGRIVARSEDTNNDGMEDRWTVYENDRGTRVEVDRNYDGKRDGFYVYENGVLALEEHDTSGDGKIDRRVTWENRLRQQEAEDSDHDGRMDLWTYYDFDAKPVRVEKDASGDGKPDRFEYYEGPSPAKMLIVRKEEDLDADGSIDVTSHYKNGKLKRKEVSNPDVL